MDYKNAEYTIDDINLYERFTDTKNLNLKYGNAIKAVLNTDLMNGISATEFDYKGTVTRGQTATVIVNLIGYFKK